jgi:hypothetical protein
MDHIESLKTEIIKTLELELHDLKPLSQEQLFGLNSRLAGDQALEHDEVYISNTNLVILDDAKASHVKSMFENLEVVTAFKSGTYQYDVTVINYTSSPALQSVFKTEIPFEE